MCGELRYGSSLVETSDDFPPTLTKEPQTATGIVIAVQLYLRSREIVAEAHACLLRGKVPDIKVLVRGDNSPRTLPWRF